MFRTKHQGHLVTKCQFLMKQETIKDLKPNND